MIINKITLQNIRSYKDKTEIDIPDGRILFQGDIGCGKSTILSAIEFALFGLGDVDGNYLLRSGEKKGSVLLEFRVNDTAYEVYRSLIRRSRNVVQDEGYIIEGGVMSTYTVGEMKSRILNIVNINERAQTKTTSLIFRYAIFTPQEMMKEVLTINKERRLEILRRAFGIDEYSIAKKNVDTILSWARTQIALANEITKDLAEKNRRLYELNQEKRSLSEERNKLLLSISELDKKAIKLKNQIEGLKSKKDLVMKLGMSIPHIEHNLNKSQTAIEYARQSRKTLEEDLNNVKLSEKIVNRLKPTYDDYIIKKKELSSMQESVERYEMLDKKRIRLEQSIDSTKNHLTAEIRRLEKEISDDSQEIENEKKSTADLETLKRREKSLVEILEQLPIIRAEIESILSLISESDGILAAKKKEIEKKKSEVELMVNIGEGAPCPKCKQKLSREHISKVTQDFVRERCEIDDEISSLRQKIIQYKENKKEKDHFLKDLEQKDRELNDVKVRIGIITQKKIAIKSALVKLEEKISAKQEHVRVMQQENYGQEERKSLMAISDELLKLSDVKSRYGQIFKLVSKYESEEVEPLYVKHLQEVGRKMKIVNEIDQVDKSIFELKLEIGSYSNELIEQRKSYEQNKGVIEELELFEKQGEEQGKKISEKKETLAGVNTQLDNADSNLEQVKEEFRKKEERYRSKQVFEQMRNWMEKCFIPAVDDIEKNVLVNINEEFNRLFQKWFETLIQIEDISVEIDDNFTPIITQNGYSVDVNSLSGGEKTSVALAYRLALNVMIRKIADMQNSLLILDEPTDGFSREQLIRLREVLDELNSSQIIMVSHERELESFVDKIYRVMKDGGMSKVQLVNN